VINQQSDIQIVIEERENERIKLALARYQRKLFQILLQTMERKYSKDSGKGEEGLRRLKALLVIPLLRKGKKKN